MKRYFEVAVPLPLRKNFTYFLPETLSQNLQVGMRVLVPFGQREVMGYVIAEQKEEDIQIKGEKVKGIKKILDEDSLFDEEILHMRQLLKTKLVDLDLSVRALNCLKAAEVETLGDLVKFNKNDLLKFRNFGKKSLTELDELLVSMNLNFGMDISKYKLDKD